MDDEYEAMPDDVLDDLAGFERNRKKNKYNNVKLPAGWTNIPRQKYLKGKNQHVVDCFSPQSSAGDNRDRVADVLLYLLNNAPGKLGKLDD